MLFVESGLVNRAFADKLSVGITMANNRKNYQHPDNNIKRVFGHFHSRNNSLLASARYHKQFSNLHVKAYALAGRSVQHVVDTSTLKYNWAGNFIQRPPDDPKGELFERKSSMKLTDGIVRSQLGLNYTFNDNSEISASLTQNYLQRTGEDKVDEFNRSFESPNYINKNIIGLAYTFKTNSEWLEATAFGKNYWFGGRIVTQDFEDKDVTTNPSLTNVGYGAAVSFRIANKLTIKSSYEKAFRLPESYEILGDGIYINPNPLLQPEKSDNLNIGARYNQQFKKYLIKAEAGYFYRFSEDFIRFNPLGPFGEYENLNNVKTEGIEGSLEIIYSELLSLNTNITYQNLTDQTKFDEGLPNTNYRSRVPNIPYFFYNFRLGLHPGKTDASRKINFYWHLRYIKAFFLTWENLGNPGEKNVIPSQLIHDLQGEYSIRDGKYNVSLTVSNLFNALAYDNFSIQKPGRAFYLKLRYFIH
jgi:hypothetical protein